MGCVGSSNSSNKNRSNPITKFSNLELQLLNLMYANLSKRCRNNMLTKQTFDIFFHSSGLIGQILFQKFDTAKKGVISFDQFLQTFDIMVKGSLRQKADVLFQIYDIEKTGGVSFTQLLKILFSYPIEELNKMLIEEPFLKYIGQNQMRYYFGAEHKKIQERNIIDEESSEDSEKKAKKNKQYVAGSQVIYRVVTTDKQIKPSMPKNKFQKQNDILNRKSSNKDKLIVPSSVNKKGFSQSSVLGNENANKNRKNLKIKSNIASLTRKYANFLFISCNLDKEKDQFSKQNFFVLIQQHPALFNVYLSGFHTYIWQCDNGEPMYQKITPYLEGYAQESYQQNREKVYLKFIRTTVFIFNHLKSKQPRDIICLEGLYVIEIQKKQDYGIVFKHRDGLYPQKQYYFDSKDIQDEWIKQTSQFRENNLFNQYLKLQRIGGGSFSNVFRGKEKATNKQVAIKVIQNFKLSTNQREVIKRQCNILRNCHHPNIIKFLGDFKTKSSLYIVTELMNEGDLFDYTKKNGFLEEYQAAIIFRQLVQTISYLNQELGIIHRDLKPQNVMIIMNQQRKMVKKIKLIDFGFAVYKDKLNDLPLTQKFAGTPGFIAPQIYKQQTYDEKIDTFSLGIILYFMLSGYMPFQSNFIEQIEDMTKNCTYSIVNVHWSNISDNAKDLIKRTLTLKQDRISTSEIEDHPWLKNIQQLKQSIGINKKKKIL